MLPSSPSSSPVSDFPFPFPYIVVCLLHCRLPIFNGVLKVFRDLVTRSGSDEEEEEEEKEDNEKCLRF